MTKCRFLKTKGGLNNIFNYVIVFNIDYAKNIVYPSIFLIENFNIKNNEIIDKNSSIMNNFIYNITGINIDFVYDVKYNNISYIIFYNISHNYINNIQFKYNDQLIDSTEIKDLKEINKHLFNIFQSLKQFLFKFLNSDENDNDIEYDEYDESDGNNDCDQINFWYQNKNTCWFNTILMCIFYSSSSNHLVHHKFNTAIHINLIENEYLVQFYIHMRLVLNFMKTKNSSEYYLYRHLFNVDTLLYYLYNYNSLKFASNPKTDEGNVVGAYLNNLYKLFKIDCIILTKYSDNTFVYNNNLNDRIGDVFNFIPISKPRRVNIEKLHPEVLIIEIYNNYSLIDKIIDYKIFNKVNLNLNIPNNEIIFNNATYILDSVILSNYNTYKNGFDGKHVISGITCNGKKYIYNGWINNHPNPCKLYEFDWLNDKRSYYFDPKNISCNLNIIDGEHNEDRKYFYYCIGKGQRFFFYVKNNKVDIT